LTDNEVIYVAINQYKQWTNINKVCMQI